MLKCVKIAKTIDELEAIVSRCFASNRILPENVIISPFAVRCDDVEVTLYKIVEEVNVEDVF